MAAKARTRWSHNRLRFVLGLLAAGALPAAAGAVPIAFEGVAALPTVDCVIDTVATRCQLDTGDEQTATLPATPAFAGLPVIDTRRAAGIAGVAVSADVVKVGAIRVGDMELKQPGNVLRNAKSSPYPDLGLGFFQAMQTVTFDFRAMTLTRAPPSGATCPDRFRLTGLLEVPAAFDGQAIHAVWDTGTSYAAVDTRFVSRHPDQFQYVRDLPPGADATAGSIPARMYRTSALALCGRRLQDLTVIAVDLSPARGRWPDLPDILLGADLLRGRAWAFDFRDGRWSVN